MEFKKTIIAAAVASAISMPAFAGDVSVSGHVNMSYAQIGDGENSATGVYDQTASGSRFRIKYSEELGSLKAGVNIEYAAGLAQGLNKATQANGGTTDGTKIADGEDGTNSPTVRQGHIFLSGVFGNIKLGQASVASDGTAEADLSGSMFYTGTHAYQYGAFTLINDATANSTGTKISSVLASYDGDSRKTGIHYSTPNLGGATLKFSMYDADAVSKKSDGTDDKSLLQRTAIGLNFKRDFGIVGLDARYGTTSRDKDADSGAKGIDSLSLSVAVKAGPGKVVVNYADSSTKYNDTATFKSEGLNVIGLKYAMGKMIIGYQTETGTWKQQSNVTTDDLKATSTGITFDYKLAKKTHAYLGSFSAKADDVGTTSYKSASSLVLGMRQKF